MALWHNQQPGTSTHHPGERRFAFLAAREIVIIYRKASYYLDFGGFGMDKEILDRAEAIQQRLLQLRDSL